MRLADAGDKRQRGWEIWTRYWVLTQGIYAA